jgi:hypothetical protein
LGAPTYPVSLRYVKVGNSLRSCLVICWEPSCEESLWLVALNLLACAGDGLGHTAVHTLWIWFLAIELSIVFLLCIKCFYIDLVVAKTTPRCPSLSMFSILPLNLILNSFAFIYNKGINDVQVCHFYSVLSHKKIGDGLGRVFYVFKFWII